MSFEMMAWAVEQDLPCTEKCVLLLLANRVNKDTGQCTPSMDRLARDCGLSKRATIDAVKRLRSKGLVDVISRSQDGVNLPNAYMLKNVGVVQQLHEGVVQELHGGSAGAAPKPVIQPVSNKPLSSSGDDEVIRATPAQVVELYHQILPSLPRVKVLTEARARRIRSLGRTKPHWGTQEFWESFFHSVSESDFLMGRSSRSGDHANWQCDIDFLLNPAKAIKVIEGAYR